jgi:eukaryotic-like serine/threonine-protein kinase
MGYQVGNKLASGGMGEVYFALQTAMGGFEKLVLIKRIHSELEQDDELSQMFLNEARMVANLRHPNVVETFDVDRDAKGLFLVMGYLPGVSLRQAIEKKGSLPVSIVIRMAADIASAMCSSYPS